MLRKRFRRFVLSVIVVATGTGAAQGQSRSPEASAATVAGAVSPRAAIWAATADYVYRDDRDLAKIQTLLLKTIRSSSVQAFNKSIDKAVAVENKQIPGQTHLLKFQGLVKTIQGQLPGPNDASALAKAIVGKLDDNDERMADRMRKQQLQILGQRLNQLAAGAAPAALANTAASQPAAGPAVSDPAPADVSIAPEGVTVAAPLAAASAVPTGSSGVLSWVSWLALILSGLSFVGMMLLFKKQNRPVDVPAPTLPPAQPERANRQISQKEVSVSWNEMREYVDRQMDERLNSGATPALAVTAPTSSLPHSDVVKAITAPLSAPPPTPRLRTQYANEAPFNNSFPARALSDQPGTYSMFVIVSSEQQPDQGTFAVAGNLASHVRDHRSVLKPVCEYVGDYPLGSESRVITVEPGHVRRRGDDWEVMQRAKVRFE